MYTYIQFIVTYDNIMFGDKDSDKFEGIILKTNFEALIVKEEMDVHFI